MTIFEIAERVKIVCEVKNTRNGFKHEATLLIDGQSVDFQKVCYLNRTWERFTFETVIERLIDKTKELTEEEKEIALKFIENHEEPSIFGALKMIAKIGDILNETEEKRNDWKAKMLTAGLENYGLFLPKNWNELPEEEKKKRLDGAIEVL
jgi:hypothetical protein